MLTDKSIAEFRRLIAPDGEMLPSFHIVLGSGFGASLDQISEEAGEWQKSVEFCFDQVSGLASSTVSDHAGRFQVLEHRVSGQRVIFQLGRLHGYEGHSTRAAIAPVMIGRLSGIQNFLLTNAAGGLDSAHHPGDVMLIRDHVNMTGQNPLVGENPRSPSGEVLGPRFPDLSSVYDQQWRTALRSSLDESGVRVHEGVYIGLLGPSFETPAEIQLFSKWGIHAVGMSTVWEAIALKHAGARVAGLSLISNAAAGLGDGAPLDHELILETCRKSARKTILGILKWLERAK